MIRRSPSIHLIFCLLLTAMCPVASVFSQSATATLSGTVEDANSAVIPGATVTVENVNTSLRRQTTTNGEGYFTVPLLPPSTYTVRVEGQGFSPAQINNVVLNVGDQKSLQIQLNTGNLSEMVQITVDAPLINESPAVGTVVDRQFVENIPLNGRSFQSLLSLTPGVQVVPSNAAKGQFSVNGQRPSANAFIVDGVSANFGTVATGSFPGAQTSGNLPGLTTFGTTQSLVSVDALEEFKVQTSGTSAEYGRQPGGQISIVTRSGTNQFHGSLFDYLRNDKLDANDWFANRAGARRPPERQNDFGGTFSGPVLLPRFGEGGRQPWYNGRNRTFFFFSYEGLRLRLPQFNLSNVPTLTLRQTAPAGMQPILNSFPVPNGRDLGNGLAEFSAAYSDPSNLDATSIRIDHTFSSRLTLFGRYNKAPSETTSRLPNNLSNLLSSRINTQTVTLGVTASLKPRLNNQFRFNLSNNGGSLALSLDSFGGAAPVPRNVLIPSQYDSSKDTVQGDVILNFAGLTSAIPLVDIVPLQVFNQRQLNLVDSLSWGLGSHQLRFGADYRRMMPVSGFNAYDLIAIFASMQQVQNSTAGTGSIISQTEFRPVYSNFSAYGQDTWKLSRRLALDLGLRWEVNPPPGEANGNLPLAVTGINNLPTMQLASRGTSLWKTTYNNVAPRIGVAYVVSEKPGSEIVARGGFGVYYDTGNEFGSAGFTQFPFSVTRSVSSISFPLLPTQVAPAPFPSLTPPYGVLSTFDPALKLPYTLEWNVAVQRSLGISQAVTVAYVGAAGRRLLQQQRLSLGAINPNFTILFLTTNKATSDYHALQAQVQRRLSRGLQMLVSYTWSHAIDEDSAGSTARLAKRGNADFDVRHNAAAAVTYDIPSPTINRGLDVVLGHWSVDTTVHLQSALPLDLVASTLIDPATGTTINVRPNLIGGVPLYVDDPTLPGGRRINRTAFSIPPTGQSGTLGRNVLRGLPAWQVDFALRRQINLTEKLKLQLRAEAFNLFNHPNFGTIQTSLTAANFGQATNMLNRQLGGLNQLYQIGGPRSMQFALKLIF
jgi:Carboxypeptidase regulatory-like domain/TonB-dependent Receptor Plug Domain